ncbi:hypothetical protein FIBSPDRAFT_427274 [Athelia psychrophila]|uniref:Uncharacterized protein n=1 Tax=Athelia psychrophila TaxID=1759441 RepID=A0A166MSF2_9AGAM|nr:hypothetical protein FIBSPDRAFT_427274 [Fibularhizoctonia sp. CBS 109695]
MCYPERLRLNSQIPEHYDPRCEPWMTVHPWVGLDYGVVGCEAVFHRSSTANLRNRNTISMSKSIVSLSN